MLEVPAGTFRTIQVEPKVVDVGLFKAKGKLTIWVTDDHRHIPVRMKSKIPVGSITADLVRIQSTPPVAGPAPGAHGGPSPAGGGTSADKSPPAGEGSEAAAAQGAGR